MIPHYIMKEYTKYLLHHFHLWAKRSQLSFNYRPNIHFCNMFDRYQVKSPRYPIAPTYINQILCNCRSNRPEVRVTSPRQIKNSTVEIGCKLYGFHDSDCHVSAKFKFKDENVQNAIIN